MVSADTVYGMSDTAYGTPTFTPALKRLAVVVILGIMMTILDTTIVNVAIETLGRDFDASVATIQWVATGYLLALVAYLAAGIFLHMSYIRFFYVILGLAGAVTCMAAARAADDARAEPVTAADEGGGADRPGGAA